MLLQIDSNDSNHEPTKPTNVSLGGEVSQLGEALDAGKSKEKSREKRGMSVASKGKKKARRRHPLLVILHSNF